MNIIGIIPARMGSSRFPGKPLAKICGLSMIEHVYRRSALSKSLADVYIATCDDEIKEAVESFGGKAVMTSKTHERASDRVAEAMLDIEKQKGEKVDIVVMIQGDEPLVFPEMIDLAVQPLLDDKGIVVTNLMGTLETQKEIDDPNEIKVVVDKGNFALYFSRAAIPSTIKAADEVPFFKQICIIPFRREFLLEFNDLDQTPLEKAESVDMMRVLENGKEVKMVLSEYETYSVDTLEDLVRVEEVMKEDKLFQEYKK